jgi:ribonuclease Z
LKRQISSALIIVAVIAVAVGYIVGRSSAGDSLAEAQEASVHESPLAGTHDGQVYYPGTEDLSPDEIRIISCGTGMPIMRPAQAAACFLVELGNGDKFIFDIGNGSAERLSALRIPYDYLNKIFLSHLHTDHFGDLANFFVGRQVGGATTPLRVWGPSGSTPELGTQYALENLYRALTWDIETRKGAFPPASTELEISEFDWRGENVVVYEENGVTIRSWPAVHAIEGSVSFSLEWNDLKFVFSGDNYPNQYWLEYATDADVVIHECFPTVSDLIEKMSFPVERALIVGAQVHTPPPIFGKLMSMIEPREAIAYHFYADFDIMPNVLSSIRLTYDGPVTLADDYMVWNVTKDEIRVREIVHNERTYPPPITRAVAVDQDEKLEYPAWFAEVTLDFPELVGPLYEMINQRYGTDFKPPF